MDMSEASKKGESMDRFQGRSTLRLIQSINTIPSAFPTTMNTCGRICVHQSGRFVVVSNRGHESIAIYRVKSKGPKRGELCTVGYFHTRGETPRHFQFDSTGQYLIVANQDSDSIAVFSFNLGTGQISFTGNEYRVPSPNFVCCCPVYQDSDEIEEAEDDERPVENVVPSRMLGRLPSDTDSWPGSDTSTMLVNDDNIDGNKNLEAKLSQANLEIAELRKQLQMLK